MRKLKLLFAVAALAMGGVCTVNAQSPLDKTTAVAAWTGGNYTSATDGIALKENYVTNTTTTGNIFEQTVSGLDQGYYKVTLYANAIYTPERGFSSDASDFDSDRVFIFATGNGTTQKTAVPIKYGIITTGSETFTVNAYVGSDGNLTIGMVKEKVGTNWHSIATKSLMYYGNDLTAIKSELNTEISTASGLSVAAAETATLNAAVAEAQSIYDSETATFDEVDAAITTLKIAEKYAEGGFSSATLDNPVLTTFVVNGDFTSFTDNWPNGGWYTTAGVGNHGQMTEGSEKAWENYSWGNEKLSGKMYFRMTDIPNGAYSVSIDGFSRTAASTYVYANKERVYLSANETYETKVIPVIVKNNILEVGEYSGKIDWMKIKNVSVSYTGDPLASYKNTIKSLIETGEGLDMTGIPTSVSEAMTNDINTYKPAYNAYTEEEECTAAVTALQTSVQKAQAYVAAKAVIDRMNTLIENTNVYTTDAYNTFNAYITKFNNAEYTTEEANALNGVIFGTGWHSTAAVDDFLISAWDANPRDWGTYHVNTWSTVGDSGNPNFVTPCIEYWVNDENTLGDKVMTASLSDFVPGAEYKITATVCLGVNTGESTTPTGVTLQLNDGVAKSVCTGNRVNETRFYEGTFEATGMIGLDGKLNVKFTVASTNASWMTFRNVKYEKIADAAAPSAEELAALDEAVNAAEAHTLGFETDEFAPYNNVKAQEALAAAKSANRSSQLDVTLATAALTNATWTANTAEVNAICGGDFTQYETVDGQDLPYGWNLYNTGNNSRIMGGTEGTSNTGLSATTSGKALLMKFNATYGESVGYTMPLKAGKIYKITFKYGGWSNTPNTIVNLTDPSNAAITLAPNFKPATNDANSNAADWYDYTGYFVATTSGDYKLHFNKVESGQQQIVIADIDLRTAEAIEFADGSVPTYAPGTYPSVKITRSMADRLWYTAIYPFAIEGIDKMAELKGYNSETGALSFKSITASVANKPFLMRSETAKTAIELTNVDVTAAAATDASAEGNAVMKGVYATTNINSTDESTFYVMSNNTIYPVSKDDESKAAIINPYRGYIQVTPATSPVRGYTVDGEETAIEGMEIVQMENGSVYNLNGQRVENAQKGLYIVNGKKVVVK